MYQQYLSKYLSNSVEKIIEIRTGSDSDFPRIKVLLDKLNEYKIPYLLTIYSAHRTPEEMIKSAKYFPNIYIPKGIETKNMKAKIAFSVAVAGGSAHIAGMTASETSTPVVALPVSSSAGGIVDSTFSMINMPPGIPNGFISNQENLAYISKYLLNLNLDKNFNKVYIDENIEFDENLLTLLGLEKGESPIKIVSQNLDENNNLNGKTGLNIIIPIVKEQLNWHNLDKLEKLDQKGFYMGINLENNIRPTNALLYVAKILGIFNLKIRENIEKYSKNLTEEVLLKNKKLLEEQV